MCFSATASFSAAAVCGAIGVLTVRRASRPDLMLALIPVIFALHQAFEGVVWLTRRTRTGGLPVPRFIPSKVEVPGPPAPVLTFDVATAATALQ